MTLFPKIDISHKILSFAGIAFHGISVHTNIRLKHNGEWYTRGFYKNMVLEYDKAPTDRAISDAVSDFLGDVYRAQLRMRVNPLETSLAGHAYWTRDEDQQSEDARMFFKIGKI